MKTKEKIKNEASRKKEFDSVSFFRGIKEEIAKELEGKSFKQQKAILKKLLSGEIKFSE